MVPIDPNGIERMADDVPRQESCICWCGGGEGMTESLVGFIAKP
jgi:hypothetical protein